MAYSSIVKPEDYFNTVLYTGNGSTQSITGVGFQPDWTWIKGRSGTYGVSNHKLFDSVRGATKTLFGNLTNVETTQSNTLTSFDSDGFSLGDDSNVNNGSTNYVSWNWLAGGSTASNSDGSITSTVSANTTAGFSIVSYTGTGSNATIGHGLGAEANLIILKERTSTSQWQIGHHSLGFTKRLEFRTDAVTTTSTVWNDTAPTSSVFSVGTSGATNENTQSYIAYCFAEKQGYSKFGTYQGNGNSDGVFVYTGFKPAWIITKRTDSSTGGSWQMYDNKRLGYNVDNNQMKADKTNSEDTSDGLDILSNGFKMRNSGNSYNASGSSYIYMAFAEEPLVANDSGTAVPVTAR